MIPKSQKQILRENCEEKYQAYLSTAVFDLNSLPGSATGLDSDWLHTGNSTEINGITPDLGQWHNVSPSFGKSHVYTKRER